MTRKRKLLSVVGMSLVVLAACDGSDGVLGNAQAQFGNVFAAAFNAPGTAEPSEALAIRYQGVNGVSLTAEPVDI
jgi:hypothetical protein